MTDKYSQVLAHMDTFRTANYISEVLGWTKSRAYHYIKRLNDLGYLEKHELVELKGAPCQYKRLVDELSPAHIEDLINRKCKHRSEIMATDKEVSNIYNNYLFGITPAEATAKARVITETYSYSEKKKSPRVYIGCSFGLVGW